MGRDAGIDRLYQLPLDEFTAARNALAKESGADAAAIRALAKPPVAAWAVNQLYWRDRRTWDALIAAAEHQRRVNAAVLAGRAGDVRAAGTVHDEAVQDALRSALAILAADGHPATDATRQIVLNTLRAAPGDEAPGRLTRALQPGGFEMLTGLSVSGKDAKETRSAKDARDANERPARSSADARALTRAREAAATAERALADAEQAVRRHEFEIARASRDAERAGRAVEQARTALDEAKKTLASAERDQREAEGRRDTAEAAAKKAASGVAAARRQAESTRTALKKIQR